MKNTESGSNRLTSKPAEVLARVRLFRGLGAEECTEVISLARVVPMGANQYFFSQGQAATVLFVLLAGKVKVSQINAEGHQIVLRYVGAGETFGCVPLYGGTEYPATAETVTRCRALGWDRPVMDRLMKNYPIITLNALELLGEELSELRTRYMELSTERVERRVARALLRLVNQAGRKVDEGVLIDFPLSRQDLGEITGTTLHTVSRIVSRWEEAGIVATGRRRFVIRRPHGLVSIAEDLERRE